MEDDSIDTRVVVPVVSSPSSEPRPVLTTHAAVPGDPSVIRRAFTPGDPLRLWTAGDSLLVDTGYALQRASLATPVIRSVGGVDGKIGTGLDRPDMAFDFGWIFRTHGGAEWRVGMSEDPVPSGPGVDAVFKASRSW